MNNITSGTKIAMPMIDAANYDEQPGFGFVPVELDGKNLLMVVSFSESDGHITDISIADEVNEIAFSVWPETLEEKNAILAMMNQDGDKPVYFLDSAIYYDTETQEMITLDNLLEIFNMKSAEEKAEYSNSFPRWLDEITGKNGTLVKK